MWINYPAQKNKLKFFIECSNQIGENKSSLVKGIPIKFNLREGGGYSGKIKVRIDKNNSDQFWADWKSKYPSRFPARIRTVAYVLFEEKHFGEFTISHFQGEITIT